MEKVRNLSTMESKQRHSLKTPSILQAITLHAICGVGLSVGFWIAREFYSINLVSHPLSTLRLIWPVKSLMVIIGYSWFRIDSERCSYVKAVGRGMLALPAGALVNALGAIVLGAPVGTQYLEKTLNWSLLMSSLTFVPASCVFGSSWTCWQCLFAHTKPQDALEYMICIPAHGAIIGAWLGAWPMPLDWERPWQEWPICVTYGAIAGYVLGLLVSFVFVVKHIGRQRIKRE